MACTWTDTKIEQVDKLVEMFMHVINRLASPYTTWPALSNHLLVMLEISKHLILLSLPKAVGYLHFSTFWYDMISLRKLPILL